MSNHILASDSWSSVFKWRRKYDVLQIAANIGPTLTRFSSRSHVQVLGVDLPLSVVKSLVVHLDVSIFVQYDTV